MGKQPLEHRPCMKGSGHDPFDILGFGAFFLQMLTGVGALILLFAALSVGRLWNVCWKTLSTMLGAAPLQREVTPGYQVYRGAGKYLTGVGPKAGRWTVSPIVIKK